MKNDGLTIYLAGKMAGLSIEEQTTWRKFVTAELDKYSDMANYKTNVISCMIIRKLIITYFLSFNIVVQYNSDTMDF